jgi:hypothetical protein
VAIFMNETKRPIMQFISYMEVSKEVICGARSRLGPRQCSTLRNWFC